MIGIIVGGVVFLLFILLILRYIYTLGVVSIKEKEGINKEVEETAAKELLTTDPDVDTAQQISCPESTKSTYKMKDLTEIPVDDATKDTCIRETDVLVLDTSANSEKIKPVNRFGFFSLSTVRSIRVRSPPRPTSAPITTPENTPDRDAEIMIGIDSSEISAPSDDISLKQLRDKTIAVTNSLKSISKDAETPIDVLVLTESTQSPQETHIPMQIQPVIDNWMSVDRPAPISDPLAPLIFNSNNSSYTQTSAYNSPVTPLLPGQSPLIDIMSPIRYTTPSIPQTQSLRSSSVPNVSTLTTNISTSAHYYSESNSAPRFTGT